MTLYAYDVDHQHELQLESKDDASVFVDGFDATRLAPQWTSPRVCFQEPPRGASHAPDFLGLVGAVPALSERAADALSPELANHGELLPLSGVIPRYFVFNVLTVEDVMDEASSQATFVAPGRLLTLERLALKSGLPDALPTIFKLPQWLRGRPLLTHDFVERVVHHNLTGLRPRPLA